MYLKLELLIFTLFRLLTAQAKQRSELLVGWVEISILIANASKIRI